MSDFSSFNLLILLGNNGGLGVGQNSSTEGSNPASSAISYGISTIILNSPTRFELVPVFPRVPRGQTVRRVAETALVPLSGRCTRKSLLSGFERYHWRRTTPKLLQFGGGGTTNAPSRATAASGSLVAIVMRLVETELATLI